MDSNLALLENAAVRLKALVADVVFVGGSTLGLLITDKGAAPTRATVDVDVIVEITTYADYVAFSDRLRALGFSEDSREAAPLCRWLGRDLTLDVIPVESWVLGFSNRWYRGALITATPSTLPSGAIIRLITAPYFLGTKMEAFRGRGNRDFFASHDLEDFMAVVDGRGSLLEEVMSSPADLRAYLRQAANDLLHEPRFLDALPGLLLGDAISQQRLPLVLGRLRELAGFMPLP